LKVVNFIALADSAQYGTSPQRSATTGRSGAFVIANTGCVGAML
jgi:hypothetical protein